MARELPSQFISWRTAIENALFEHYEPYAEALAVDESSPPGEDFPRIEAPSQVWPHASLAFVAVTALDGVLATELGYATGWDEEHILGVRFRSGEFLELCGSVLPP